MQHIAPRRSVRLVAGLDAAFTSDGRRVIGAVVLWDMRTCSVVEQHLAPRSPLTVYLFTT